MAITSPGRAAAATFCDRPPELSAAEQHRQLGLVAAVKQVLADDGGEAALIARSGTDLERFDLRYSHAGIALRDSAGVPWSVRQLYYACDESRPRLFDQGLTGFLVSAGNVTPARLSVVLLPAADASRLAAAARDNAMALGLLSADYSANAFAFSTRYQNCNQWVAELMAGAWGGPSAGGSRLAAQQWLLEHNYAPHEVAIPSHGLMFAGQFVPLLHMDDHPVDDLYALKMRVSTPASLEAWARQLAPTARRVEFCAVGDQVVVRDGWEALGADCAAKPGDKVLPL